ncbi:S24/S26 family peptidase [Sphingobacterium oryzagri]|uniref:S24/S26 family peptidase n=1 Tax=Sphingobacterium oryzagri TaxID=3025669 RepID=A0ABY7WFD1_9SPHI|nr:S24/S26 family peptidase [Sphingobacterium sp. KACC 22765]WDF68344.1 S24/S26 family peptidase [Sphingobacterium sp. KACC 22765]
MRPFIYEGDKVTVKAIPLADLRNGMIALAHADQGYVLHRVVGVQENHIALAGDGNLSQIELVEQSKLMGVVQQAFRADKALPVCTGWSRMKGMLWYYVRPVRRVFKKMKG